MRAPGFAIIALVLIGATLAVLIAVSGREHHGPASTAAAASPVTVSGGGFTLSSTSVDLATDDATFPPGPNVDLVN